jgi:hypothetical protein
MRLALSSFSANGMGPPRRFPLRDEDTTPGFLNASTSANGIAQDSAFANQCR